MEYLKGDALEIAELGDPVLREKAREVEDARSPQIQKLIDDLIATAFRANGVGIAAPQVSRGERIFIISSHPNARYPDAPVMEPEAIINPKIVSGSGEIIKDWEGCLSIPGLRGLVPRAENIYVKYTSREGREIEREYIGFLARVFQHEYDHLNGVLFLDRLETIDDIVTEKEYARLMAMKRGEDR